MQSQQMSMATRGGPPPGTMPGDPGMMGGGPPPPGQPGGPQYSASFQQFQQQIYSQRGGPPPRGRRSFFSA